MSEPKSKTLNPRDDRFERDLHPDAAQSDQRTRTAYDCKPAHRRLQGFTDDELKQISVLTSGTRLSQGSVYIDLAADDCQEFTAVGGQEAGRDNLYVAKSETDYQLWNRLIGVDNPERTGEA